MTGSFMLNGIKITVRKFELKYQFKIADGQWFDVEANGHLYAPLLEGLKKVIERLEKHT